MNDSRLLASFSVVFMPTAKQEDGLYYPAVTLVVNGQAPSTRVWVMGFEDEKTALTMARSFANDERVMFEQSVNATLAHMREVLNHD